MIEDLLSFVRPALEAHTAWDEISTLVRDTMRRGTGARRQRQEYQRTGRLEDVVDLIASETARGTGADQ